MPTSTADDSRRRRRVRRLQRYVLNPPAHLAVRTGLVPGYVIVETTGRRTGKRRHTVVGMHLVDEVGWVIAEQGRHAGYVSNLMGNPEVRVCLRGRWRAACACIVPEDDADARLARFERSAHAASVRRFGTELLTVRFDFATD